MNWTNKPLPKHRHAVLVRYNVAAYIHDHNTEAYRDFYISQNAGHVIFEAFYDTTHKYWCDWCGDILETKYVMGWRKIYQGGVK